MSLAQRPSLQDRQPSNGPAQVTAFASNNPFRRGISPVTTSDAPQPNPNGVPRPPPPSNNPFLVAEQPRLQMPVRVAVPMQSQRQPSPPKYTPFPVNQRQDSLPRLGAGRPGPEDMSRGLNIGEHPAMRRQIPPPHPGFLPPRSRPFPPSRHRPTRSQDEGRRLNIDQALMEEPVDIFATPPKNNAENRSRRNSESSVQEAKQAASEVREDLQRPREREYRRRVPREMRPKEPREQRVRAAPAPKPKRTNPQMDVIDKLDVTSVWGAGFFHHDGPFDAANPLRNRKNNKEAPMHAFAEGSANNALGGSGPVHKAIDLDRIHGLGAESFADYNAAPAVAPAPQMSQLSHSPPQMRPMLAAQQRSSQNIPNSVNRIDRSLLLDREGIVDPKNAIHEVHGEESAGLGTSTFLEGAPAPAARIAIQRRTTEPDSGNAGGGLTRKKSIMQKLRGNSGTRVTPDEDLSQPQPGRSPPNRPTMPLSAGGRARLQDPANPFFAAVPESSENKKDPNVSVLNMDDAARPMITRNRTMSSPQSSLLRTRTNESANGFPSPPGTAISAAGNDRAGVYAQHQPENSGSSGGGMTAGLLSRVKSLRGGRKPRAES